MTTDLDQYPAIDVAYERISEWYESPQKRLDVIEGRISGLIGFAVTVTLAIPTLSRTATGEQPDFAAWQLIAALIIALGIVIGGLWQVHTGTLTIMDPRIVYEKYLHLSPIEAKYRMFYWSTEHFAKNLRHLQNKAAWLDYLTAAFVGEAILLAWWILG